jgi:hypothetical protein
MVGEADIAAHVRVVTVNPVDSGLKPEEMDRDHPQVIAVEVIAPMRGAIEGQRLLLRGGGAFGPDLAPYERGSEWVVFLQKARILDAQGKTQPTRFFQAFSCSRFSARVVAGKVNPLDLNPVEAPVSPPSLLGSGIGFAVERRESEAVAQLVPVKEYVARYSDWFARR